MGGTVPDQLRLYALQKALAVNFKCTTDVLAGVYFQHTNVTAGWIGPCWVLGNMH